MAAVASTTSHPRLSASSVEVVAATAAVVAQHANDITSRFYDRLFQERPALLRLFNHGNQANGDQAKALAAAIVAYATQLIDPDAVPFDPVLRRIAYKHISLGIRPEQYLAVGTNLMRAIGDVLGDAVTPEIAAAWSEVYWLFATQLIATEAQLYAANGIDPVRPLRPHRVVRRVQETGDAVSLLFEPVDGQPWPAPQPGQYVTVFVDLPDGARQPRQYTVSNGAGNRLRITVRRARGVDGTTPEGLVSSYLHDHVGVGDVLELSAPAGDVTVEDSDRPLLIATAGSGISTAVPIIAHLARQHPSRTVIVCHGERSADEHALFDEIRHLALDLDDFAAYSWYSVLEADVDSHTRCGRMDLSDLALPDDLVVHTCGPLPFMQAVRTSLIARGVRPDDIHYEVFGPDLWAHQPPTEQVASVPSSPTG